MLDLRNQSETDVIAERTQEWPPAGQPRPELVVRAIPAPDEARRAAGLRDMVGGAVLIAIGLAFGGSVFLGNPGALDWVFDVLGVFWLCRGVYAISTA